MRSKLILFIALLPVLFACNEDPSGKLTPRLVISENGRYLATEKGDPFFWMGDTGWLLFEKLGREEAVKYFDDRKQKGFNVIQVMVIHNINKCTNFYGDSALVDHRLDRPLDTDGNSPDDPDQYDYWDHVDYLVRLAREKGLYLAMVPVWGSNVRSGQPSGVSLPGSSSLSIRSAGLSRLNGSITNRGSTSICFSRGTADMIRIHQDYAMGRTTGGIWRPTIRGHR